MPDLTFFFPSREVITEINNSKKVYSFLRIIPPPIYNIPPKKTSKLKIVNQVITKILIEKCLGLISLLLFG